MGLMHWTVQPGRYCIIPPGNTSKCERILRLACSTVKEKQGKMWGTNSRFPQVPFLVSHARSETRDVKTGYCAGAGVFSSGCWPSGVVLTLASSEATFSFSSCTSFCFAAICCWRESRAALPFVSARKSGLE